MIGTFALAAALLSWFPAVRAGAQDGGTRIDVAGTRVSLVPPPGFELADRFPGFVGPEGASIQVSEIAGPFKEVSAGLSDPELASKQGMRMVVPPQAITLLDGTSALWLHLRQGYQGQQYLKWIVVWGDPSASVLLTAAIPESAAPGAESMFRQSFMTARWNKRDAATPIDTTGLPFQLRPAPGWTFVLRTGPSIGVGLEGTRVPNKTGSPLLIAAASTEDVPRSRLPATAASLFKSFTPDIYSDRVVRTGRSIQIAGKPAHELVGTARHHTGYPAFVYLAVIAEDVGHLQLVGMCRLEAENTCLPAFRAMAESITLRAPGPG